MTVRLSPIGGAGWQFLDDNGDPLSGGKLYTYSAGTTTPATVYTNSSGAIPHTNPIILDAAGRIPGGEIWIDYSTQYKFVLYTSTNVLLGTYDNIFVTDALSSAATLPYYPPFSGAVTTNYTVANKLSQIISVKDFGATGDGLTDDTAALQSAASAVPSYATLFFPAGTYLVSGQVTFTTSNIAVVGQKAKIVQTGANIKTLYFVNCTDVEVSGLHIYGKGASDFNGGNTSAGINGAALWFDTCTNLNVHDNFIENCAGGHIRSRYDGSYSRFTNNRIVGIGTAGGIVKGDNDVDVAIDIREAGTTRSKNVVISNNVISNTCFGIFVSHGDNITITNNVVRDIPGQHGIYNTECNNTVIASNAFTNIALIAIKAQQIQSNNATFKNFVVSNNAINNASSGIAFELLSGVSATLSYTDGVTISGNTLTSLTDEYGLSLDGCRQLSVTGNVITRCGSVGVFIRNCSSTNVSDNFISNAGANGIWANGLLGDIVVENNTIRNAVQNYGGSAATDGSYYYYIYAVAAASLSTPPRMYLRHNTMVLDGSVPTLFSTNGKCVRAIAGVDVYWQDNVNLTGKGWQFDPANLKFIDIGYSPSVDYTSGGNLAPNPPKYGRGRRELYGTTDPASAAMTDTFMRGDICWNATPSAGGTPGWVCVTAGTPGTWKAMANLAV